MSQHLATERWTADRVRAELIREDRPVPRYEFIEGALLVSPSPAPVHALVVAELLGALRAYVEREGVGRALTSPSDIEIEADTTAQPDVFVVPEDEVARVLRPPRAYGPWRRLLLAAEVVSPSTAGYDRLTKRRFYARCGVPEYWVIDPDARLIERTERARDTVTVHDTSLLWRPEGAGEALALDVRGLFDRALGPLP